MNKKWLKISLPFVIILIAILLFMALLSSKQAVEQKPLDNKPPLVEFTQVMPENSRFTIHSQGLVSPLYRTQLTAEVSGKVVKLNDAFIEGGFFKQGEILVRLETADYATQVKSAEAELAKAQAALKEEKARGEVAKQEWNNMLDKATDLALRIPQLETEKANVASAEAKLEQAKRNLERTFIRAPYDGMVFSRSAQLGQYLQAGSSVGMIYATEIAEIRLPVSLEDSQYLDLRQKSVQTAPAKVSLSSKVSDQIHSWSAQLVRNEAVVDEQSRMLYVVAQLKDPYNLSGTHTAPIHFGQFVEAGINGRQVQQVYKVERSLLTVEQELIVLQEDMTIKLVKPHILRSEKNDIYVDKGLEPEDRLVTSALSNPVDGMKVRINSTESQQKEG